MEITEGNKLIAEFMGGVWDESQYKKGMWGYRFKKHHDFINETNLLVEIANLRYDKSWDWLMPVVEKIRELGCVDIVISIKGSVVISWDDGIAYFKQTSGNGRNSIQTTYEAVIEFIKWYNETKENRT